MIEENEFLLAICERLVTYRTNDHQLGDRRSIDDLGKEFEAIKSPLKVIDPQDDGLPISEDSNQASQRSMALLRRHAATVTDESSQQLSDGTAVLTGALEP